MSSAALEPVGREAMLSRVIDAAADLTQGWEHAFANPISSETRLVKDLGCQSLDIVVLIGRLSRDLNRHNLPFEQLLMAEGKPVKDISLQTMADFLWEHTAPPRVAAAGSWA